MANNVNENHLKDVSHVPKFDGCNFREWSYELRMILQQLGLLSIMEARVGHTIPTEVIMQSKLTCKPHIYFKAMQFDILKHVRIPDLF
jgi:hypothetical protein